MKPDWFDDDELPERMNEFGKRIKKSEAYPAILGAIAGGIAGALMAAIIAGMLAPKRSASNHSAEPVPPAAGKARGGG